MRHKSRQIFLPAICPLKSCTWRNQDRSLTEWESHNSQQWMHSIWHRWHMLVPHLYILLQRSVNYVWKHHGFLPLTEKGGIQPFWGILWFDNNYLMSSSLSTCSVSLFPSLISPSYPLSCPAPEPCPDDGCANSSCPSGLVRHSCAPCPESCAHISSDTTCDSTAPCFSGQSLYGKVFLLV